MAYHGVYFNYLSLSKDDMLAHIYAFVEACGWELYDAVSDIKRVYISYGEDDWSVCPCYVKIWLEDSSIYFRVYAYWDIISHVGSMPASFTSKMSNFGGTKLFFGSRNFIHIFSADVNHYAFCGLLHSIDDVLTSLTSPAAQGETTIQVANTDGFHAGMIVQLHGIAGEGRETIKVGGVINKTTLLVSSLAGNYGIGSAVGRFANGSFIANCANASISYIYMPSCIIDATGVDVSKKELRTTGSSGSSAVNDIFIENVLSPFCVEYYSAPIGILGEEVLFRITQIAPYNILYSPGHQSYAGAVATAGPSSLSDFAVAWEPEELAGKMVFITDGSGRREAARIVSNDENTIVVDKVWETLPDVTSMYRISDAIYRASPVGPAAFQETSGTLPF